VLIPANEEIEMKLDGREKDIIQLGSGDERRKQVAQGGGIHAQQDKPRLG